MGAFMGRNLRFLCAVLFCAVAGSGMVMAQSKEDQFRTRFAALAAERNIPGMAVGYIQGAGAPVVAVQGVLFKGTTHPVAPDARWHIGSITKSFTATMIMRLVERGVLSLDAPLGDLLPEFRDEMHADWRRVTLNGLLSHSAGLAANFTRAQMMADFGDDLGAARLRLLRAHWGKPLPGTPGKFNYSNMGYVLAGFVAETRTGQPWQALIRDEIATPLGLKSLGFGPPMGKRDPRGHRGWPPFKRAVDPTDRWADNPAWLGPAGTIHLSMADLLEWGRAHLRACRGELPKFLSTGACAQLHRPVAGDYALGWNVMPVAGLDQPVLTHDGSNTMWYASLSISPEADVVMALTMNQASPVVSGRILQDLAKIVLAAD